MGVPEWLRFHNAQTLLNAEDAIREELRNGTYAGREPIEDEEQLDQMVRGARREVEAGRLFHFENVLNNYDLNHYSVMSDDEYYRSQDTEDEDEENTGEPRRGGLLGWLFGR